MDVRIYSPAKTAMQAGVAKTKSWILEYEPESARTPEPLMGWVSSEDTLNQVKLTFESKDEAVLYAEARGWSYNVSEEKKKRVKPRSYADNFQYKPSKKTD